MQETSRTSPTPHIRHTLLAWPPDKGDCPSCADSKLAARQNEGIGLQPAATRQVTLDDHSEVDPLLPIPNRTVKRFCADDSGRTSVKVGHRQALMPHKAPHPKG